VIFHLFLIFFRYFDKVIFDDVSNPNKKGAILKTDYFRIKAVGVIVAESADLARRAASAVSISYKNRKKPILNIREAMLDPARVRKATQIPPPPENLGKVSNKCLSMCYRRQIFRLCNLIP
jgi:xanthine dehydrogenase molybdopterin-binding subunit B